MPRNIQFKGEGAVTSTLRPDPFDTSEQAEQARHRAKLVETLASGEMLVFVGAGSSVIAGYPTGMGLLKHVEALAADKGISPAPAVAGDFPHRMEALKVALGSDLFYGAIQQAMRPQELLGGEPRRGPTGFHKQLVSLPVRGFLTTNYDPVLQSALTRHYRDLSIEETVTPVCIHDGDMHELGFAVRSIATRRPPRHIIHLHGFLQSQKSIIAAASDYEEAYGFKLIGGTLADVTITKPLCSVLRALFMTRSVLFVGFSLSETSLNLVLSVLTDNQAGWGEGVHFAILPIPPSMPDAEKARAREQLRQCGIAVIFFEIDESEDAANPFGRLEVLVSEISAEVSALRQSPVERQPATAAAGVEPSGISWVQALTNDNLARDNEDAD